MEGGDYRVVGVVEEGERLCAVRVGLVELDAIVDDWVGMQMLGLLAGGFHDDLCRSCAHVVLSG